MGLTAWASLAARGSGTPIFGPSPTPVRQTLWKIKRGLRKPRAEVIVPTFRQKRLGSSQPIVAARLVLIHTLLTPKLPATSRA
jgi:hypothetical protein